MSGNVALSAHAALNNRQYGKFHAKLGAVMGCLWAIDAMSLLNLIFLVPSLACEWSLSWQQQAGMMMLAFATMSYGSYFWGALADQHGRRTCLLTLCVVTVIGGACVAAAPSFVFMLIAQCVFNFAAGGMHVAVVYYGEFPIADTARAVVISLLTFGFVLGAMLQSGAALFVLSTQKASWRWLMALSTVFAAVPIPIIWRSTETPAYLRAEGRNDEADEQLSRAANVHRTQFSPFRIEAPQHNGHKRGLRVMCSSRFRRLTLSVCLVWAATVGAYLVHLFLADSLFGYDRMAAACNEVPPVATNATAPIAEDPSPMFVTAWRHSCTSIVDQLPYEMVGYTLAEMPGIWLMIGLMSCVRRKYTWTISLLLMGLLMLLLQVCGGALLSFLVLLATRACAASAFQTAVLYTRDAFPTSVRATAVGLANCFGRVVGIAIPQLAAALMAAPVSTSVWVAAGWCCGAALLTLILPRDAADIAGAESLADARTVSTGAEMRRYQRVHVDSLEEHDATSKEEESSDRDVEEARSPRTATEQPVAPAAPAPPTIREHPELTYVRNAIEEPGANLDAELMWTLAQRLQAAAQHASGADYDALTEEALRLRLLSKRLNHRSA